MNLMNPARLSTRDGTDVMLEGIRATGDLRGVLLEMSVEQRFRNPTDQNIEVVYSFPLPWGAVLLDVHVQLGDRHLSGAVVEKKQAEARYEETLSEGNAAIMLERNHDASYTLNLGNLAASEACVITLCYAQTLQFEQQGLRLLIPTVIAPRYGDPVRDGGLQPHQAPEHSLTVEYPFDIELRLHDDMARARVASPSHPIGVAVRAADNGALVVSLGRRGALDRDFVLVVDQLAHASTVVAAQDSVHADHVVALASFCPRIPVRGTTAIAVKLLVDCSGSMAGDSIDAARRALQSIVLQMNAGDRFSLSRFGSTVSHRSRALWSTTDATRLAAQRWVSDLQANLGGTAMEAALESTFALASTASSDVLVVTDGGIGAIDATIESAKASGHRVFVVGIGSSPAETHLRRLAEETGGACDFVAPGEAVEPAVLRMFSRLRSPRLDRVSVVWPGEERPEWTTTLPSAVFDGDTVNVFALLPKPLAGAVRLLGMRAGGAEPEVIGVAEFSASVETAATLSRVAAQVRVNALRRRIGIEFAQEAIRLSVAYQLVTDQTNFLLVHERAEGEKAADMPELHKVAQMTPAGWGGTATAYLRSGTSNAPMLCRTAAGAESFDAPSAGTVAGFEIPAFLRRQADDAQPASASAPMPKVYGRRSSALSFSVAQAVDPFGQSLTPLAFAEKLRATAPARWPTSYAELRDFGLDAAVVDWLELAIAAPCKTAHAEHDWVAAFVFVMSQPALHESLVATRAKGGEPGDGAHAERSYASAPADVSQGIRPLVEALMSALDGIAADTWPDQVYAMRSAPDAPMATALCDAA